MNSLFSIITDGLLRTAYSRNPARIFGYRSPKMLLLSSFWGEL